MGAPFFLCAILDQGFWQPGSHRKKKQVYNVSTDLNTPHG